MKRFEERFSQGKPNPGEKFSGHRNNVPSEEEEGTDFTNMLVGCLAGFILLILLIVYLATHG